jgi:hypothetical protein
MNLPKIPNDHGPTSIPREIFRAHMRGEISEREWQTGVAFWVAEHPEKFRPRALPECASELSNYAWGRVRGNRIADRALSERLGRWYKAFELAFGDNACDYDFLVWCARLTHNAVSPHRREKILNAAKLFEAQRPDFQHLDAVQGCMRLDALARLRS